MRSWRSLALIASVSGALGGAQGCADDGVSLHVICPIFPTIENNVCTFDPAGETCVAEGVMNVALTDHYTQELRVESGLKPRISDVPPRGETNGLQIRSATIELRDSSGARFAFTDPTGILPSLPNPYTTVASGYLTPQGRAAVSLTIIEPEYGVWLWPQDGKGNKTLAKSLITASIKMQGVTNGGVDVESGEYIWPIRMINVGVDQCVKVDYCADMYGQDGSAVACPVQ